MIKLTERDRRLIAKCATAQCLTTSQVRTMFFPQATPDAVRKRLRKLVEARYLVSRQPRQFLEAVYSVERGGLVMASERAPGNARKVGLPDHLEHVVGINDIRAAVESSTVKVVFFFAHWELAGLRWPYPVVPDAVFSVVLDRTSTFLMEYDRGTEARTVVRNKLERYAEIPTSFPFDAVLLITVSDRACQALCRAVTGAIGKGSVLVGSLAAIREQGMWSHVFHEAGRNGRRDSLISFLASMELREEKL